MITRECFDEPTLAAMDDVALLLRIFKAVAGMNETFKNADDRGLSAEDAKPTAKQILDSTKGAGCALMKATFGRDPRRLDRMRRRHLPALTRALDSARDLARQEHEAFPEIGEHGVFRHHVALPLLEITQRWAALA